VVRFDDLGGGRTRIDVKMHYRPPVPALGHMVAACFGCDPKREMDDDMARFKTLMETGRYPHDAARPPLRTGQVASVHVTQGLGA
jgi:uncharacterized membrane protein